MDILKDAVVTTMVGICGKVVYNNVRSYYNKHLLQIDEKVYEKQKEIDINNIHIEFVPQITNDEMVIITRKHKSPELFKYFSD